MSQSGFTVEEHMIYIAGPLFSQAELQFNSALAQNIKALKPDMKVWLPQDEIDTFGSAEEIARQCLSGLVNSLVVVAILDGPQVDDGTAFELGYAFSMHKKILGLRTDFRNCGDTEGFKLNAMFSLCTEIFPTVEKLLHAINQL